MTASTSTRKPSLLILHSQWKDGGSIMLSLEILSSLKLRNWVTKQKLKGNSSSSPWKSFKRVLKMYNQGAGERERSALKRVLNVLSEDLHSSILHTHYGSLQTSVTPVLGDLLPAAGPMGHCMNMVHKHTIRHSYIWININKVSFKNA